MGQCTLTAHLTTLECTCVDGEAGYQLCNEDGSGYAAPCERTGTGEGGDEDAGGSTPR